MAYGALQKKGFYATDDESWMIPYPLLIATTIGYSQFTSFFCNDLLKGKDPPK